MTSAKRKPVLIAISLAVVVVVIMLGVWPRYGVQQFADGELLWNADEADVFIDLGRLGYRLNGFTILFGTLKAFFWVSVPPDDKGQSGLVVRITPKGVDSFRVDHSQVGIMTVFEGHPYRPPWKWTGNAFEKATQDEQGRYAASQHPYGQFSNVDGWSRRCCVFASGLGERKQLQVKLGAEDVVVRFLATNDSKAIELERSGRPAQQIWSIDQRDRWVSYEEYQRFLRFEK